MRRRRRMNMFTILCNLRSRVFARYNCSTNWDKIETRENTLLHVTMKERGPLSSRKTEMREMSGMLCQRPSFQPQKSQVPEDNHDSQNAEDLKKHATEVWTQMDKSCAWEIFDEKSQDFFEIIHFSLEGWTPPMSVSPLRGSFNESLRLLIV